MTKFADYDMADFDSREAEAELKSFEEAKKEARKEIREEKKIRHDNYKFSLNFSQYEK